MSAAPRFRPLALPGDVALLHGWLAAPHVAPWWGRHERPADTAAYLRAELDRPHMRSWVVEDGGAPVAFVQTYRVADDPLAAHVDVAPGDRGWHVLVGAADRIGDGTAQRVGRAVLCGLAAEPDQRNARMLRFCAGLGGEEVDRFAFDDKPAVLVRWTRATIAGRWPQDLAAAERAGRRWDALGVAA